MNIYLVFLKKAGYIDSVVMTLTLALNKIGENQLIFSRVIKEFG
jgi:hypothetical protein